MRNAVPARFAVGIDEAAGLLDDAVDRRQAEAGALADFLGRKERLEDLVDDLRRNAGAGIARPRSTHNQPTGMPLIGELARIRPT